MGARKKICNRPLPCPSYSAQRGFTLIEITFAIVILAGSLVVLVSLQSSVVERTLRDEFTLEAMLIARRIQTALETSQDIIPIGEYGPYAPVRLLGEFAAVEQNDPLHLTDTRYLAHLLVEWWGIAGVSDRAMKRITLTISWGEHPLDSLEIVYFIPDDESTEPTPA